MLDTRELAEAKPVPALLKKKSINKINNMYTRIEIDTSW